MTGRPRLLVPAALAVAAVGLTAAPAVAAPTGPAHTARTTELVVSYEADAGFAAAVVLQCQPPGGFHPEATRACADLAAARGNPDRLKVADTECITEPAPITAKIEGTWRGRELTWSHTFGNPCELTRATGSVFAFLTV